MTWINRMIVISAVFLLLVGIGCNRSSGGGGSRPAGTGWYDVYAWDDGSGTWFGPVDKVYVTITATDVDVEGDIVPRGALNNFGGWISGDQSNGEYVYGTITSVITGTTEAWSGGSILFEMEFQMVPGLPLAATDPDVYEPDDTDLDASLITVNGAGQTHTFHVDGESDWIAFDVSDTGLTYRIETYGLIEFADTYIFLYDTDGFTELDSDDDGGAEPWASMLEYTFPSTGTYYVEIRDLWQEGGGYDVSVSAY